MVNYLKRGSVLGFETNPFPPSSRFEAARSLPVKVRRIGPPARCALTRCFSQSLRHARSAPALRSSRARARHGTRIRHIDVFCSMSKGAKKSVGTCPLKFPTRQIAGTAGAFTCEVSPAPLRRRRKWLRLVGPSCRLPALARIIYA